MPSRICFYMAGGKGERFWPLSSASSPKHLQKIFDGECLMQHAVDRLTGFTQPQNIKIVTSAPQADLMRNTLSDMPSANIIVEPQARDTAAAVALAVRLAQIQDPQAVMAMLPADHMIRNTEAFQKTLGNAFDLATTEDVLVTIGIKPTHPATGYGYLKRGECLNPNAWCVDAFKEKPDEATAQEYVNTGDYFWNAGMFVWSVPTIVAAFEKYVPELWNTIKDVDVSNEAVLAEIYPTLQKTSIDYALMEKADNVAMVEAAFDWSDVGAWDAYADIKPSDDSGNVCEGAVACVESQNSLLLNTQDGHIVAGFGLEDLVVVHTPTATLIAPKGKAAELKTLLKTL